MTPILIADSAPILRLFIVESLWLLAGQRTFGYKA
jgi:hypothetical protein